MSRPFVLPIIFILLGLYGLFNQIIITGGDDTSVYYHTAGKCLGRPSWFLCSFQDPEDVLFPIARVHGEKLLLNYSRTMPYRDFVSEYPPAALPLFILPRLFTNDVPTFYHLFAGEMAITVLCVGWITFHIAKTLEPGKRVSTMVSASWMLWIWTSGRVLIHRFDVMVILFAALGALYVLRRRWGWAGFWFGFGAAMKIYPIFILIPATILALGERRSKSVICLLGSAALVPLASHVLLMPWTGPAVFNYLSYHSARGIEVESIWSQLILFFANSGGYIVHSDHIFGCDQLGSTRDLHPWIIATYVAMLLTNILCLAIAFFSIRPLASGSHNWRVRAIALFLATIAFTVMTAKVLSIQYVFWLYPMAMLLPGKAGKIIFLFYALALAMGNFWFPDYWVAVAGLTTPAMILVFCRNMFLLTAGVMAALMAATYTAKAADAEFTELPLLHTEPAFTG